jgi:hypothetical protein
MEVNVIKQYARLLQPVILLTALSAPGQAQDAKSLLDAVAKETGAANLGAVQYSGSGSSYNEKGEHQVVTAYSRQLNLNSSTSTVQIVRRAGSPPASQTSTQSIAADSAWNVQYDYWLTPYGFLKGAMTHNATVETRAVDGETYRVVSFTLPGNHRVSGYINPANLIERVETRIDNDVLIQSLYRDYQDFGGLKVPTVVLQKRAGNLSLLIIVKEARRGS